jgi:hypothetical protein
MKERYIIFAAWAAILVILCIVHVVDKRQGVWINCGLSEISPDFTPEMRQVCRQARSNYEHRIK